MGVKADSSGDWGGVITCSSASDMGFALAASRRREKAGLGESVDRENGVSGRSWVFVGDRIAADSSMNSYLINFWGEVRWSKFVAILGISRFKGAGRYQSMWQDEHTRSCDSGSFRYMPLEIYGFAAKQKIEIILRWVSHDTRTRLLYLAFQSQFLTDWTLRSFFRAFSLGMLAAFTPTEWSGLFPFWLSLCHGATIEVTLLWWELWSKRGRPEAYIYYYLIYCILCLRWTCTSVIGMVCGQV